MTLATLAGQLMLRPGAGLPAISSSRAPLAGRLLRGRPAYQAPALLSGLYALCGQAHRLTAQLALDAARGVREVATPDELAALAAETMREHVRRIWLDWPRLLGGADADAAALRACPLFQNGADGAALRGWLEGALTGAPAAQWLAHWRADPRACMARWSGRGATMPARLLGDIAELARESAPAPAGQILLPHAQSATLSALAAEIDADLDFERRPSWRGQCCETGSWTRLAGAQSAPDVWLRLGARVAELAALAGDAAPLSLGALQLGPGQALAWSEMARGLLLHRVRLDADGTVADYRVLAPTEWNFHPRGTAAGMLAQMPAARTADQRAGLSRRIGVLVAAFDPCVPYQIEFDHA